ncbi:phosphoribosylglycinamide formyltransferase [Bosea sp. CS1GBMeth4]|uniref:phosphoribosylglycinamide formyltransferase n=1 Tax=Bosea sp. CS1GBMeth4 TaxID=1892849 RepID=UPI001647B4A9|nr:phosphoribosylglycinamide formyltransferase [Bosea sp. CS1GBMeth4]
MSTAAGRVRTAILISGRGSNMVALIEAARAADFPAEIALVAANLPDAGGLERARSAGIAAVCVDHRPFGKDREGFERALDEALRAHGIELVALAGFMRVLTPWFVTRWQGRLINIHPSLLPDFRGTHTHARALEAGVAEHGCTVHFVVPELDAGPTILQARVPVLPGDDEASLSARVLEQEHRIYPQALALVASGAARLENGAAVGA